MQTVGVALINLLEDYGVQHVFGIPGVHTIELYRGLAESNIVHHTPRHEQGAGFMADGYARVSGKPGVCFVITGPGLTNIATAMGQALADSIPMLVISSVNDHIDGPISQGNLHEMPNQSAMIAKLCRHSQTIRNESELPPALALAFSTFVSSRPGPVHLQLPVSLLGQPTSQLFSATNNFAALPATDSRQIDLAVSLLQHASAPVLLVGGGARHAAEEINALAQQLDAPTHLTINARGILPTDHPLALPASGSTNAVRKLVGEADVVLAIGTEMAPTDYDMFRDFGFRISGKLVRCDIDANQIHLNVPPDIALLGDAKTIAQQLTDRLISLEHHRTDRPRVDNNGQNRTQEVMQSALREFEPGAPQHLRVLQTIQDTLHDAIIVGDSTQLIYSGNMIFNTDAPNRWFNSSVGFGTLGYALPAAIGASVARRSAIDSSNDNNNTVDVGASVACVIGDGGVQFVLGELGTLKDSRCSVAIIVWCNNGYREIKTSMESAGVKSVGVDLIVPDFEMIANAYGIDSTSANTIDELEAALVKFRTADKSMMIVIDEHRMLE